jgi:dTDP-glucose pyrophosphorylase
MRDEYELTESIQVMIDDGNDVRVCDCIADDINLTFPSDLLRCSLLAASGQGHRNMVDPTARVNRDAVLDRVVVGPRAVIERPITLRRSVILEDAVIRTGQDLDGFLVSPTQMVDCRTEFADWPADLGA